MSDKLNSIYTGLRDVLASSLGVNRRVLDHPGAKGEGSELRWENFLREHLPQRYHVARGFVIDRNGEVSEQIDLIVYDRQYTPHLYRHDQQVFIPAESVYAMLEVKQTVDKGTIEYAGKKAASVRRLERTSAPIAYAAGTYEPKDPFAIVAGLLALESSWSPSFGETMQKVLGQLPERERLDFGCAAADGAFQVDYAEDALPAITVSTPEHSLVFFLLSMLHRLQSLGTVPAIDFMQYLATVNTLGGE